MMALSTRMTTIVCALIPTIAWEVPPTPQTVTFLDNNPGTKAALAGDGIGAVFGAPLATRGTEPTTKDFVEEFLITDGNVDILGARGVDGNDLTFNNELVISNGKFKVFTYKQTVIEEGDLLIHGGLIKAVVLTCDRP